MIRYRFYIGTRDKAGAPVPPSAFQAIGARLIDVAGGFTAYCGQGAWRADDGSIKLEDSVTYEVLTENSILTATLASQLAALAKQECVLWTRDAVTGGFAYGAS